MIEEKEFDNWHAEFGLRYDKQSIATELYNDVDDNYMMCVSIYFTGSPKPTIAFATAATTDLTSWTWHGYIYGMTLSGVGGNVKAESSTVAIAAALEVLKQHGILTILAYRGHDGGQDEYDAVRRLLLSYAEQYDLQRIDSFPPRQTSPVLFILRKTKKNEQIAPIR